MRPASSLALMIAACAQQALAADYAREERWAQEIAPAIVVGDAVYLSTPSRPRVFAILTGPAGTPKGGVVVVHGLGVHPDWGLNGGIRTRLADAGFVTLSVQMPVLASGATRDDYRATLPRSLGAHRRGDPLSARKRRHDGSRSSRTASARRWRTRISRAPTRWRSTRGWRSACSARSTRKPKEPVLDIVAERDFDEVRAAATLRARDPPQTKCSRQMTIADTDHYFDNKQAELAATIAAFLERVFAARR